MEKFLTSKQVCEVLAISMTTLKGLIRKGRIKRVRVAGGPYRFAESEIERVTAPPVQTSQTNFKEGQTIYSQFVGIVRR